MIALQWTCYISVHFWGTTQQRTCYCLYATSTSGCCYYSNKSCTGNDHRAR